jgi:hypothetical protein
VRVLRIEESESEVLKIEESESDSDSDSDSELLCIDSTVLLTTGPNNRVFFSFRVLFMCTFFISRITINF